MGTFPNKRSSLRVRLIAGWFTLSHGVLCVWNGTRLPSSRTPTLSVILTSPSSRNRRVPLLLAPFLHLAPPSLDSHCLLCSSSASLSAAVVPCAGRGPCGLRGSKEAHSNLAPQGAAFDLAFPSSRLNQACPAPFTHFLPWWKTREQTCRPLRCLECVST